MNEKTREPIQDEIAQGEPDRAWEDRLSRVELVPTGVEDEQRLVEAREVALLDQVQQLQEAATIIERRSEILRVLRVQAIKDTDPETWVLGRDRDGRIVGFPTAPACYRMAKLWGISVYNLRPRDASGNFCPDKIARPGSDEIWEFRGFADARAGTTGEVIEQIEASRSTDEDFIGRVNYETKRPIGDGDIRKAVATLLRSKAIRILTGTAKVSYDVLTAAWGVDRAEKATKGHGFGTSTERGAERVADDGVREKAIALGREVLSRVGGDESAARDLLREITSNPPKFGGFTSVERLTKIWQVENAAEKLAAHPTFGDRQVGG